MLRNLVLNLGFPFLKLTLCIYGTGTQQAGQFGGYTFDGKEKWRWYLHLQNEDTGYEKGSKW